MKLSHMIQQLEQDYPSVLAESWDSPGLQVGHREQEIHRVYLALDASDEVIGHGVDWKADLLLTHHPLLMSGLRQVNDQDLHGRKILKMAENHMAHYAMHTNYDVVRMGELCSGYLGLQDLEILDVTKTTEPQAGIGTAGMFPHEMSLQECAGLVKQRFGLDSVKVFGSPDQKVKRAALCPGSGKSLIPCALEKQADVYITGDIGHHEGMDAVEQGMSVIDAGHYGLEHVFIAQMEAYLKEKFPKLAVETEPVKAPFWVLT